MTRSRTRRIGTLVTTLSTFAQRRGYIREVPISSVTARLVTMAAPSGRRYAHTATLRPHSARARAWGAAEVSWRDVNAGDSGPGNTALHGVCEQDRLAVFVRSGYTRAVRAAHLMMAATAIAFGPGERPVPDVSKETRSPPLIGREREIAALVAQGLSTMEIAARPVIAERTAEGNRFAA